MNKSNDRHTPPNETFRIIENNTHSPSVEPDQLGSTINEREEFLVQIFEHTPSPMWISDKEGTVIRINQALRDNLLVSDDDIVGHYNVLQDSQVIEQGFLELVTSVFSEGKHVKFTIEYDTAKMSYLNIEQGVKRIIEITMAPILNNNGETSNVICMQNDITRQKQAEIRNHHLNSILNALRKINQLIVLEKDRETLVQKCCDLLMETRELYCACILLVDENMNVVTAGIAGLEHTSEYKNEINEGRYSPCIASILQNEEPFGLCSEIVDDGSSCFIRKLYDSTEGFINRLEYDGHIYGVFTIHVPPEYAFNSEEIDLFKEIAGDIGFALYNIDTEKQIESLAKFPDENPNPVLRISYSGKILYANEGAKSFLDYWNVQTGEMISGDCHQLMNTAISENRPIEIEHAIADGIYTCFIIPVPKSSYVNIYGIDVTQRRHTETLLAESEEKYRLLVDNTDEAFMLTQPDGTIETANPAASRIFGWTEKEICELGGNGIVDTADPRLPILLEERRKNGKAKGELTFIRKDGTRFAGEFNSVVFIDSEGTEKTSMTIRDISDRKRAEEELGLRAMLLDNASDGICLLTLDRAFVYVNEQYCETHGYQRDELIGMNIQQMIPTEDIKQRAWIDDEIRQKGSAVFETTHSRKDGTMIKLEVHSTEVTVGETRYYLSIERDITARKQAEEQLREISLHQETILSAVPDIIMEVNTNKVYTWANQAGIDFFGDDVIGKEAAEYFLGEQDTYDHVEPLFSGEEETVYVESYQRRKDGAKRLLAWWCRTLKDVQGNVIGSLSAASDITERQESEDMLRQSELFTSSLLNNAPNPINVINSDTSIRYVNPALEKLTGYSFEELIGLKAPYPFWGDETGDMYINRLKKSMKIGLKGFERQFTTKDGRKVWVQITNMPVFKDGELDYLLASWIDITESKATYDALMESEERYRNLVNSTPIGVYIAQDGAFKFVNPEFQELTGYNESELLEMRAEEIIHPDDRAMVNKLAGEMIDGKRTHGYEFRVIRSDGVIRWAMETVTSIIINGQNAFLGSCMDITERKKAEDELRQSEEKLYTTMESLPQGLMVTNNTGIIVQVNKSALAIYGYDSEDEMIAKSGLDFAEESDHKMIRDQVKWSVSKGRQTTFIYTAIGKNGIRIPIETSIAPIKDAEGHSVGLVGIFEDITERQKMQENLMVTDRLASVGELAAGIAHELNNPLTGVIGFSDMLMERNDLPEDVREDLEIINKESIRASQVARNLLTFARKHPNEKSPVNINDIIRLVLELRAYEQRVNNIEVLTDLDETIPEIIANDFELQQVLINIIINAEHFMIESHGEGRLEITTGIDDNKVVIRIADNGPGIDPDSLTRIFDPFYTTKDVGKGTGLGLSICYGIITEHGGTIRVTSKQGEGAVFTIELPANKPS